MKRSRALGCPAMFLLCSIYLFQIFSEETLRPGTSPKSSFKAASPLREIEPGIFMLGDIRLEKSKKIVSFPATLNMREGFLEYLLVTSGGKTHESLLQTTISPKQLQVALLLIGAKAAPANLTNNQAPPANSTFQIELRWKDRTNAATDLIFDRAENTAMKTNRWLFNGSEIFRGAFLAEEDGSIISLIEDPKAMINSLDRRRLDDENWMPLTNRVPAVKTSIEVRIKIL